MASRTKSPSLRSASKEVKKIQSKLKTASRGAAPAKRKWLQVNLKKLDAIQASLRGVCDPEGVSNFNPEFNACAEGFNPLPKKAKK